MFERGLRRRGKIIKNKQDNILLKIFLTKFILDGLEYSGPYIHAESFSDAELVAEVHGLEVEGELSDIVDLDLECETRVLH